MGLSFVAMEMSDASFHKDGENRNKSFDQTESDAQMTESGVRSCRNTELECSYPRINSGRDIGYLNDGSWKYSKTILVVLFIMISPIALLVSAFLNISENHLVAFVIQSVASGTFLHIDFEAVATMR